MTMINGMRVKPLEWVDEFPDGYAYSETEIGDYSVCVEYRDEWTVNFVPHKCGEVIKTVDCYLNSMEDAKAAAQADYECRIMAALEPTGDKND